MTGKNYLFSAMIFSGKPETRKGGKLLRRAMGFVFAMSAFSVCGITEAEPISKGQVRGVLVDTEGNPVPASGFDVLLAAVLNETSGEAELDARWKSSLDNSGMFMISDVPPGKYFLVVFHLETGNYAAVLTEDHKFLTLEVPEDTGVDLGKVKVSTMRSQGGDEGGERPCTAGEWVILQPMSVFT